MTFETDFNQLSAIGATPRGGVDRQALSEHDAEARAWLAESFRAAGMRVHVDQIGNLFGAYEWIPGAPVVLTGSHLDSQPTGGRFDGAYGVLASLEAARRLDAERKAGTFRPQLNLAVVDWTNEEGARFQPAVMGSSVYSGDLDLPTALASTDAQGVDVATALSAAGGTESGAFELDPAAYVEIHVEQGYRLERAAIDIGMVTGNWAAYKYDILIEGEQSHTGATPMHQRKDAMYAAALVIAGVRDIADSAPVELNSSVTQLRSYPDSPNVVTSRVTAHVELRGETAQTLLPAESQLMELLTSAAVRSRTSISIVRSSHREPELFWPAGIEVARRAAERLGLSSIELKTLAGHDSIQLNHVVPTVMLFVPAVAGEAHNEKELTSTADMLNGVALVSEVLTDVLTGAPELATAATAVAGADGFAR
jgi:N-carbamoyl-L-amino-acid hydrolase